MRYGGGFATMPAVLVQPSGNTVVTAVGADGNLYLNWQNVTNSVWSGWQNLGTAGGGFKLMPAMIEQQNGNSVLIEVGADTNVYFNWQQSNGIWAGWAGLGNAGGGFFTTPAVLVQPGGHTVVTAVGADGNLYLNWENASNSVWSGWQNLGTAGGGFWSTPAIVEQLNGNTVLVATGLDKALYVDWQVSNGAWAGWGGLGSAGSGFTTAPAALVQPSGNTVVTAIGADGNLYLNWQNVSTEAWSGWGNLGQAGVGFTTPAVIEQHNGNTVLVEVGVDKSVYFNWQEMNGTWAGWGGLGNVGRGFVAMVSLSGQVTAGGAGMSGVAVSLTGNTVAGTSFSQTTITDFNGDYAFSVPSGGTYSVRPSLSGYGFSPASQEFPNLSVSQVADFVASPSSGTSGGNASNVNGFYGLYNPPYTTSSGTGCGDISGVWTEQDTQTSSATWTLAQSGSNVSGSLAVTSCGATVNWQVSGQAHANNNFQLDISNPSQPTDGCGASTAFNETETISLTGSCSQGSANWVSSFGSGTSTWTGQVPSSVRVLSSRVLSDKEMTAAGCLSTFTGLYFQIVYQVLDQNKKPVKIAGLVPQEQLLSYTLSIPTRFLKIGPEDSQPEWADITKGLVTDLNGQFSDHPFGQCGGSGDGSTAPGFTATFTQNIRVVNPKNNAASSILRSNQWTQTAPSAPRKGSLSNGVDVTLSQ